MDRTQIRPRAVAATADDYASVAATLHDCAGRLAASLRPVASAAQAELRDALDEASRELTAALVRLADGHQHAGTALGDVAGTLAALDGRLAR